MPNTPILLDGVLNAFPPSVRGVYFTDVNERTPDSSSIANIFKRFRPLANAVSALNAKNPNKRPNNNRPPNKRNPNKQQ